MAKVVRDIIGSKLSINSDFREDSAIRRVFVQLADTDVSNTTRAGTAIAKAIEEQNNHPETGCTAPLRKAESRQVGADTFEVTLSYSHKRKIRQPETALRITPVSDYGVTAVTVYRDVFDANGDAAYDPSTGLPNGELLFDPNDPIQYIRSTGRPHKPRVFTVKVYFEINAGLIGTLLPTLKVTGIVNLNPFSYGGITFPKGSLRFENLNMNFTDERPDQIGGLIYTGTYNFLFSPSNFASHRLKRNTNGTYGVEVVENGWAGPRVNFGGLFPGTTVT
tara:strand:- start:18879 stop:19712 length:834 start_codon:yes stop_codon:yes gene_type:complete